LESSLRDGGLGRTHDDPTQVERWWVWTYIWWPNKIFFYWQ